MRAAQSKGAADLIALWSYDKPWLVQCKYSISGVARIPKAERENLIKLAALCNCHAYAAIPGPKNVGVKFIELSGGSHDTAGTEVDEEY